MNLTLGQIHLDSFPMSHKLFYADYFSLDTDYITYSNPGKSTFVNINQLQVDTDSGKVNASGIYFSNNTSIPPYKKDRLKLDVGMISILGIDFKEYLTNRHVKAGTVQIMEADIDLTTVPAIDPETKQKKSTGNVLKDTTSINGLDVGHFLLNNVSLNAHLGSTKGTSNAQIRDIELEAKNIKLDPGQHEISSTNSIIGTLRVDLKNASYTDPQQLNTISVKDISTDLNDSILYIRGFSLEPNVSKYEYGPVKGFQTDWISLSNKEISINKIDYNRLIFDQYLQANLINVDELSVTIFRDKRLPFPENQYRAMPQQNIKNLPIGIDINQLVLNNGFVTYLEHGVKSNAPGEVFFSDLKGQLINITNDSVVLQNERQLKFSAEGQIMGSGLINAQVTFDMLSKNHEFRLGASIAPFDMTVFNRMLSPNVFVEVKSGYNERILMNVKGNDDYSYGEMEFYYDNLKIALLNKETETPKGFGNALGSFFANTFIINSNNPRLMTFRKGEVFFERDKSKSIFNFWSKSFLSGIVTSIGAKSNKKQIRKQQEQQYNKYLTAEPIKQNSN